MEYLSEMDKLYRIILAMDGIVLLMMGVKGFSWRVSRENLFKLLGIDHKFNFLKEKVSQHI